MKIDTFQTMAAIARKHFDNNLAAGQVLVASISPADAKELRADLEACAGATIFEQGQGFVNLEAKWPGAGVAMELSGIGIRVVQGKVSPEFEPHVLESRYIPVWAMSLTFDAAAQEVAAGKARADAEIATWSEPAQVDGRLRLHTSLGAWLKDFAADMKAKAAEEVAAVEKLLADPPAGIDADLVTCLKAIVAVEKLKAA